MPMTREQVRPGVTVLVPRDADRTRPGMTYKLRIAAAYDGHEPSWVRVDGRVLRLDGTEGQRRYPTRCADLHLASLDLVAEPDPEPAAPRRPNLHDFHFDPHDGCDECDFERIEAEAAEFEMAGAPQQ